MSLMMMPSSTLVNGGNYDGAGDMIGLMMMGMTMIGLMMMAMMGNRLMMLVMLGLMLVRITGNKVG